MTKTRESHNERVEAGAAWLDKIDPTWIDRIDLKRLDLADDCGCVLGQFVSSKADDDSLSYGSCVATAGYYFYGGSVADKRNDLPRGVKRLAMSHQAAVARGFHVTKDGEDWEGLTKAWKTLIRNRRGAK